MLNKHAELKEMLEIEEKQMEKCERERNEFDEQFGVGILNSVKFKRLKEPKATYIKTVRNMKQGEWRGRV